MVRALLAGTKTQTRRVMKPQPTRLNSSQYEWKGEMASIHGDPAAFWICPYGQPGDRLWVRETWSLNPATLTGSMMTDGQPVARRHIAYRATDAPWHCANWRPSIFMPRWASRLALEIVSVRVERVQDISEEDARAEGVEPNRRDNPTSWSGDGGANWRGTAAAAFHDLWNSINAKPKAVKGEDGKISHYVSYPWEDVGETRTHRGKPWLIIGNSWVWCLTFRRVESEVTS